MRFWDVDWLVMQMDIILKIMERSVVLLLMKKVIRYISIIIRMPFGVVSGI